MSYGWPHGLTGEAPHPLRPTARRGWGEPHQRSTAEHRQDTGPPHVTPCPISGGCTYDQRRPHRQEPGPRRLAPPPARPGRRQPRRLPLVLAPDAPSLGLAAPERGELPREGVADQPAARSVPQLRASPRDELLQLRVDRL